MSNWQPIETAPKDGTEVIAFERATGVTVALWDCDEWCNCADDGFPMWPTHWMPLPEPPVSE